HGIFSPFFSPLFFGPADRLHVPQPSPPPPPPPPTTTTKPESLPVEMDSEPELNALPLPPLLALPEPQANGTARPWNLRQRTRRCPAASISWAAAVPVPSSYRRRKRAPFLVALTPEEIEEDIYAPSSPSLPSAPLSSPSRRRPPPSRQRRCPPSRCALASGTAARRVERRLMEKEMEAWLWSSRYSGRQREKKRREKKEEEREKEGRREKKIKNFMSSSTWRAT
ncbi:Os11g0562266, partial [Oryza sativa Japonica Group]